VTRKGLPWTPSRAARLRMSGFVTGKRDRGTDIAPDEVRDPDRPSRQPPAVSSVACTSVRG
jgi:hypothetical protein